MVTRRMVLVTVVFASWMGAFPPTPAAVIAVVAPAFPPLVAGVPYLYVVDYDRAISVLDARDATPVGTLPVGRGALPVFSADGTRLSVASYATDRDETARLDVFDVATGRRIAEATGLALMTYKVWGPPIIAPTADGQRVYLHGRHVASRPGEAGRDECWLSTFDIATSRVLPETIPLPACRVAPLLLSADGRTLYSGSYLLDLTTRPVAVRENRDLADTAVTQSGDGRWLYALDRSGDVTVWDANARAVVRRIPGMVPPYGSSVYTNGSALSLTPDGTRLVVATDDGNVVAHEYRAVVILDVATGQHVGTVRLDRPFRAFAVSADGAALAVVGGDTLDVWEIATGARRATAPAVGTSAGPVLAPPPLR